MVQKTESYFGTKILHSPLTLHLVHAHKTGKLKKQKVD